jgi:hypothetical protein
MQLNLKKMNTEQSINNPPEKMDSSKTVRFWLKKDDVYSGDYIGEIDIIGNEFVVRGATQEKKSFLEKQLSDMRISGSGIPVFRKTGDSFKVGKDGRFEVAGYVSPSSNEPDEVIEALADYEAGMGILRVLLVIKN